MSAKNRKRHAAPTIVNSKRLSIKLVIETLLFSLLISVLVSAILIYNNYQKSLSAAQNTYLEIENGFLPSLSAGLWEVNNERVDALLDSIALMPNVGSIYLTDENNTTFTRNNESKNAFSKREMKLIYTENGMSFDVGVLTVELNNDAFWGQLRKQAIETATITSLTLFSASLFILFIFQLRVSRHLQTMAEFAKKFDVNKQSEPLALHRKPHSSPDELDIVVNAINDMQSQLQQELRLRSQVEQSLRTHQENLEELVKERSLALKLSSDQLAIAADVAALGVWQWDIDKDVLHWNQQMFSIFELPMTLLDEGLKYKHWLNRIHPDDVEEAAASLQAEIEGRGKMISDFRILLPDGQIKYIQAALKIERDFTGRAINAIGISLDITSRMEVENNLREAKEQADIANAAKSSFLANMSHEIRTPLNAVLGLLQLLQKTSLTSQQSDYVTKSQNAAKSLLNLLSDILDLSKADAGKLKLENSQFDLESLLQDLAVAVSACQKDKAVELFYDIDPRLPRMFIGDKYRLQQVLINLAGNALKFTSVGHVSIKIELIEQNDNSVQLKFSVIDTGIGISEENIAHIFDEFIQAETSTTRRFGGTGLGLVISRQLVELMGGELKATSEIDVGSRFWFEIKLTLAETQIAAAQKTSTALTNINVLVAEKNDASRRILVRNLKQHTSHVKEASTQVEAIADIQQAQRENQAFDLVLIDWRIINFVEQSIVKVVSEDAGSSKKPIFILLSAYGNEAVLESQQELASLYDEVLYKPLTPLQLVTALEGLLHKNQTNTPHSTPATTLALAGLKVLVVDDNEINRDIAFELLRNEGAQVTLASCGLQAVSMVKSTQNKFDVVLMDIQMPDIDGYEATRQIRADQRFSSLTIIALTANVAQSDIDNCLAAGMNGHIGKPFDMRQVVQTILSTLNNAKHSIH